LDTQQNVRNKAELELEEVLKIIKNLANQYPAKHNSGIATILQTLGRFYSLDNSKYDKAKKYYLEALKKFEEEENFLNSIMVLEDLASLYNTRGIDVSDIMEGIISFYRELVKDNRETYLSRLALSLLDYGFYLKNKPQQEKIESLLVESLEYYRLLVKSNSEKYNLNLARVLNNLANFHLLNPDNLLKARDEYRESLNIYKELSKKEPNIFKKDLGLSLNNLILVDLKFDESLAKQDYDEAYMIRKSLAEENPRLYGFDYAHTLLKGVVFFNEPIRNIEEASKYLDLYDDNYLDIQFLRKEINRLREEGIDNSKLL